VSFKSFAVVFLCLWLAVCLFPVAVLAEESVVEGAVFSGGVASGESRVYYLSENLSRGSFVVLSVRRVSGEGRFALLKGSAVVGEYSVYADAVSSSPFRLMFYPFFVPENGTDYLFNVSCFFGGSFEFSFFYDVADALDSENLGMILFEGGAVGYFVDLARGDRLRLNLTAPEGAEFDVLAVPSFFSVLSGSLLPSVVFPSVYNTFFVPSPKSLEFVTDLEARYLVFVVSTVGSGNFTLSSEHTGNPVEGLLGFLSSRIDLLNNLIDNLILICVVSLFVAGANLYLYLRLRKKIRSGASSIGSET
jgi:hypothetical protein